MKKVTIRYDNPKTLKLLKAIAKYFDLSISSARHSESMKSKKLKYINGVPYTAGNTAIDICELFELFTGKNIDARELRTNAWMSKQLIIPVKDS